MVCDCVCVCVRVCTLENLWTVYGTPYHIASLNKLCAISKINGVTRERYLEIRLAGRDLCTY